MQGDAKDFGAKQKRQTSHHHRLFKYLHKCKREITSQRDQEDKAEARIKAAAAAEPRPADWDPRPTSFIGCLFEHFVFLLA